MSYIGVSNLAKKILKGYVGGFDGKAKKIIKGYVGVNNKAKEIKLPQYKWYKYDFGYRWQIVQVASDTSTTNTTRWGKMILASNLNSIIANANITSEGIISKTSPYFAFSNVGGGDMPTSTGGYSGYYVASNNNGIKTGSPIGDSNYIGEITSYSVTFGTIFTWKANIYGFQNSNEKHKLNDTVLEIVESPYPNAYPDNDYQDGYWWVKQ